MGYSINNTIIIFDRIRENAKKPGLSQATRMDIVETSVSTKATAVVSAAEAAACTETAACAAVRRLRSFLRPRLEHFPVLPHGALNILRLTLMERTQSFRQQFFIVLKDDLHIKIESFFEYFSEFLRHSLIQLLCRDFTENRTVKASVSDHDAVFDDGLGDRQIRTVENPNHMRDIESGSVLLRHHKIAVRKIQLDLLEHVELV